jgi:hypothetical protein
MEIQINKIQQSEMNQQFHHLNHVLGPASVTLKLKKYELKWIQDHFTNMKM